MLFLPAIGRCSFRVCFHVVTKCEVAVDFYAAKLKRVDLMRSHAIQRVTSEVAPSGNTELSHDLIAKVLHVGRALVEELQVHGD